MKQWLKNLGCTVLALCLIAGITACSGQTPAESDASADSSLADSANDASEPADSAIPSDSSDSPDSDATSDTGTPGTDASKAPDSTTRGQSGNTSTTRGQSGSTTTRGQSGNTDNSVAPQKLRGTKMEYLTWLDTNQSGKSLEEENKVVTDFEKASGIEITLTKIAYSTFDANFASRMAANNAPDMIYLNGIILPRMQYLQPISAMKFDFSDAKTWDQEIIKMYTIKGKQYAVNMVGSKTLMYRPTIFYYNKAELKKAEQEDPYTLWKNGKWTWSKMISISKAYYKKTGNPGFSMGSLWQYAQMKGIQGPFSFDGTTVKSNFNDQTFVSTLNQQADWKASGIESQNLTDIGGISRGKLVFFAYNMSAAREGHEYLSNLKKSNTLGFVPLPKIDGQSTQYYLGEQSAYGVCKGAKNPEAVAYFLRYYLDKSHYTEKSFFFNEEALEVYYASASMKKQASTGMLNGQNQTSSRMEYIEGELWGAEKAQIPSKIESLATNQIKPDLANAESLLKNNF